MTNISKHPLQPEHKEKLFKQFSSLFAVAGEKQMLNLYTELFTEAEQIMFIKRVGIIFMLIDERSNYEIAKTLKVSEATVRSAKVKYLAGEYKNITKVMRNKSFDDRKFWDALDVLLRAGLPPRGSGRWKSTIKNLKK